MADSASTVTGWANMTQTNWPLLLGVVSVVFGGIAVLALVQILTLRRFKVRGVHVVGTVASVERHESGGPRSGRSVSYSTTVEYKVNGKPFEIDVPLSTNPALYNSGESVPVYYLPGQPEDGRVVCFREYAKWAVFLIASLTLIVGLSIVAANA